MTGYNIERCQICASEEEKRKREVIKMPKKKHLSSEMMQKKAWWWHFLIFLFFFQKRCVCNPSQQDRRVASRAASLSLSLLLLTLWHSLVGVCLNKYIINLDGPARKRVVVSSLYILYLPTHVGFSTSNMWWWCCSTGFSYILYLLSADAHPSYSLLFGMQQVVPFTRSSSFVCFDRILLLITVARPFIIVIIM